MPNRSKLFLLLASACLLAACDFPRDPLHTTELARESGKLRVGVIHNPPWTDTQQDVPRGRETELIEAFTAGLGAAPEWKPFGTHEGFAALEHGEIDVLIGGLVRNTPYHKAAFTRPYAKSRGVDGKLRRHVIAVRRGENRLLVALERHLASSRASAP